MSCRKNCPYLECKGNFIRYLIPDDFRFRVFFFNLEKVYEEKFRNDDKGDDYEVFRKPYPELTLGLIISSDFCGSHGHGVDDAIKLGQLYGLRFS